MKTTFSPTGFWSASDRYDLAVNRILQRAGINSLPAFLDKLGGYLREIPELKEVSTAAAKHDMSAALSGGSARAIVAAFLKDIEATGKADVRPQRSLFQMLEGSDVDVIVMKRGKAVPEPELLQLAAGLNRVSGADLVAPLPSVERRLYSAEWDVVDAHSFAQLNEAFGGDSASLFGLGLDENNKLVVYDPAGALEDIFKGRLSYIAPNKPYEHPMVTEGKFDPSLDGLRVIRMAGQMRDVGVDLSPSAEQSLQNLGQEANRRAWEVQARMLHSPGGKLERRWEKYTKKLWVDHKDPAFARTLLEKSGYLELLTLLGLRHLVLHEMPAVKKPPVEAHPTMQLLVQQHRAELEKAIVTLDAKTELYSWQPQNLSALMSDPKEPRLFGHDAGPLGGGLTLKKDAYPDGSLATQLLATTPKAGVRVLDMNAAGALVDSIISAARAAYDAAGTPTAVSSLGEEWKSRAIDDLYTALGIDGGADGASVTLSHGGAVNAFRFVQDRTAGIVDSLRSGKLGDRTEHGVRALLASQGSAGFHELEQLMRAGKVTVAQLFPAGAQKGGLFADVPTVEPRFAAFLAEAALLAKGLSEEQRKNAGRAVEYLRGDLPASLAVPGGGAATPDAVKRTGT